MSFSLSCLISHADLLLTDASLVYSEVPASVKGFIRYIPTITSNQFDSTGFSYSMQASTASYVWRNNWYFDQSAEPTISPSGAHSIIMWKYYSALTFDVNFIYEFRINLRMQSSDSVANQSADFSKILLCFGDTDVYFNSSTIQPTDVSSHFRGFEPSSYTWNSSYATCELVYRVPIFPGTLFPDLPVQDNGTGTKFISIPCMAIQDIGSGAISFIQNSSNGTWRYSGSFFPRTTSSVKLYTAEEWQSHVTEQGFDDLSRQIDLSTGQIVDQLQDSADQISDSIDQGVSDILNAGDPLDTSDFEDFHNVETQIGQNLMSTHPFSAESTGRVFNLTAVNRFVAAMNSMSDWYTYLYDYNTLAYAVIFFSLAAHLVYLTFKFLI